MLNTVNDQKNTVNYANEYLEHFIQCQKEDLRKNHRPNSKKYHFSSKF